MKTILFLIPLALLLGGVWLGTFLWSLRSGQYEDLEGAAMRILIDDDDRPAPDKKAPSSDNDGDDSKDSEAS